jgi:transcriptional regulator with XRE-family HTH domain
MDIDAAQIGRRAREVRAWRGMSLTATAGLAGMSSGYLSMIERGHRPVTKRTVLESLATALRVSPAELTGKPYPPADAGARTVMAAMADVGDALTGWWVGEVPDSITRRPWGAVLADVDTLNLTLRPNADYTAQVNLIPNLIRDLLAAAAIPAHRTDALIGLLSAYKAAAYLSHDLGVAGLPMLAAERMHQAAEALDDPGWLAYASYQRAQLLSGTNRPRQYQLAVAIAQNESARAETRGLAHLTAALSSATQGDPDMAMTHLDEAAALADHIDADVSPWMQTNFGRVNVGIWRVSIGVELGHGAKIGEIAAGFQPSGVSKSRQAAFWLDYGRGLLADRKHHKRGLAALLQAEKLAPQKVRNNVFAREAVSSVLAATRREAGSRDLRGLAWRMGVAPIG